jgi:hypothetical protein
MSTTGVAPDTVIVSSSAPTQPAFTVAGLLETSASLEGGETLKRERHGVDAARKSTIAYARAHR